MTLHYASDDIERRLTELEIKASFNDDLLDKLDQVVIRQQGQIDALQRALADLRQPASDAGSLAPRSLRDDLPPHF